MKVLRIELGAFARIIAIIIGVGLAVLVAMGVGGWLETMPLFERICTGLFICIFVAALLAPTRS